MKFTDAQIEKYAETGYVIIDCPFPDELTRACLDAVAKYSTDPTGYEQDGKKNHYRLRPQDPNSYWSVLDHSLPFLKIILHEEIIELARQLAGDDNIYLRNGGINEMAPGRSVQWHRDAQFEYVEFMHYFGGGMKQNGCLRVIPGTHIGTVDELNEKVKQMREEQGLDMNSFDNGCSDVELDDEVSLEVAGSQLIVRSSRIYHATWVNNTTEGRLMSHWLFRESSAQNHRFHFEDYLTTELIECLTQEQKDVLWLDKEFDLDDKYSSEKNRELGNVKWGVV